MLDHLKRRLGESRGRWPQISEATGVPYFTITNIAQGKVENPGVLTVQKLLDYFGDKPGDPPPSKNSRRH